VRNISDVGEAAALAELGGAEKGVAVGAYVASPRGALATRDIAEHVDPVWVELRLLQAAMFGLPPRILLTREPLGAYVSRGLYARNPRHEVDPVVAPLLRAVARASQSAGGERIGIRVSGPVSEQLMAELRALGLRRFAVDFGEAAPALLALAKASRRR
jgi:pyruvate, orthophosphate dikinase